MKKHFKCMLVLDKSMEIGNKALILLSFYHLSVNFMVQQVGNIGMTHNFNVLYYYYVNKVQPILKADHSKEEVGKHRI